MLPDWQFFKVSHVHGKPKHPIRGRNKEPYHSSSPAVLYGTMRLMPEPEALKGFQVGDIPLS